MTNIDNIWERLAKNPDYEKGEIGYLEVNKKVFKKIQEEFIHEFEIEDSSIENLEEYFGLKIIISDKDESFRIF